MYAIIDIETTGGNPKTNRITEIAIYNHDGNAVTQEFQSLVNPEQNIPDFITRLTGISNEMVSNAPKFYEIAKSIVEMTKGRTIVAHNASFDYGFLRYEFRSLGYDFTHQTLCTVKMSRERIPGHRSYSLGKLCNELGIELNNRHRAAGDALATVKLFELLTKNGNDAPFAVINNKITDEHNELINTMPNECGVYKFIGKDDEVLYVGKSTKIKTRVRDHFRTNGHRKKQEMIHFTERLEFELTGSEMISLLRETELIKSLQPKYNRAQRTVRLDWGLYNFINQNGYSAFKVSEIRTNNNPVATYKSRVSAQADLERITDEYDLCHSVNGLYTTGQSCFQHIVGKCNGACIQKEPPENYNLRVSQAMKSFQLQHQNFAIIDVGRSKKEISFAIVENGCYLGCGYMKDTGIIDISAMKKASLLCEADNKDTRRILQRVIKSRNYRQLILY